MISRKNDFISGREKLFLVLLLASASGVGFFSLLNQLFFHNTVLLHAPFHFILIVGFLFLYFVSVIAINYGYQRIGLLIQTATKCMVLIQLSFYAAIFLLTTPFPDSDFTLLKWDHALRFYLVPFMHWFAQYPFLESLFKFSYSSWSFQLLIMPCVWAVLLKKDILEKFFLSWMICVMAGGLIYYLFPTSGPASILRSALFTPYEKMFIAQFENVHHHVSMMIQSFGIIGLPSFHTIAAILIVYFSRNEKYLFYPLLILNFFLVLSTLALGEHFLVDVLAAFVMAPIAILLTNWVPHRFR